MSLADKIRAARQFSLELDGVTYTLRRPTDAEAAALGDLTALDLVRGFVTGWNHTELSLGVPGGTATPAPFGVELWAEWVNDQPNLWGPISDAITEAYRQHAHKRSESAKN